VALSGGHKKAGWRHRGDLTKGISGVFGKVVFPHDTYESLI
jgi:hypothetical protein